MFWGWATLLNIHSFYNLANISNYLIRSFESVLWNGQLTKSNGVLKLDAIKTSLKVELCMFCLQISNTELGGYYHSKVWGQ